MNDPVLGNGYQGQGIGAIVIARNSPFPWASGGGAVYFGAMPSGNEFGGAKIATNYFVTQNPGPPSLYCASRIANVTSGSAVITLTTDPTALGSNGNFGNCAFNPTITVGSKLRVNGLIGCTSMNGDRTVTAVNAGAKTVTIDVACNANVPGSEFNSSCNAYAGCYNTGTVMINPSGGDVNATALGYNTATLFRVGTWSNGHPTIIERRTMGFNHSCISNTEPFASQPRHALSFDATWAIWSGNNCVFDNNRLLKVPTFVNPGASNGSIPDSNFDSTHSISAWTIAGDGSTTITYSAPSTAACTIGLSLHSDLTSQVSGFPFTDSGGTAGTRTKSVTGLDNTKFYYLRIECGNQWAAIRDSGSVAPPPPSAIPRFTGSFGFGGAVRLQ